MRLRTGFVGLVVAGSMAIGGTAMAADHAGTVDATGPADHVTNGQINHGHFVSNFVRALKVQLNEAGRKGGIGCLVRLVAQSSDGKGDEGLGTTTTTAGQSSTGDLILALGDASCEPGDDDHTRLDGNGPGNGKGHAYGHSKGVGNPHNPNR